MNAADVSLWRRVIYTRLSDAVRGRWDASLDWRIVVAEAQLPADIADIIGRVVGRTRLWRPEKVDVAKELIAHFQDGLDAGRTSEQLIQAFGDPQQAARLIRRAKKRGRPLAWHVWYYGLLTVWVAIALYALSAIYLLTRQPIASIDYLSGLNADARNVAPDERAWPLYREALLALGCQIGKDEPSVVAAKAGPGGTQWPQAVAFLTEHKEALTQLREAAALPHLGYEMGFTVAPEDRPLLGGPAVDPPSHAEPGAAHPFVFEILMRPHLQMLRDGAYLLESDVYRAVDEGDAPTAHRDVVALLGMSRQLGQSPVVHSSIEALFVEWLACDAIQYVITVNPELWPDQQLAELAHCLSSRQYDAAASWLEGERIFMPDMIQRLYSDDGHGDGTITYTGLKQLSERLIIDRSQTPQREEKIARTNRLLAAGIPLLVGIMASRAELEEEVDKLLALAAADFQRPLWEEHRRTMDDEIQRLRQSTWSSLKYVLIELLPGKKSVDRVRRTIARANGRAEGVKIGLALELYHRENSRWPESLDELAPRWLPAVPVDRINGGPLGYRVVDDRPIVYSLGSDADDDGGRLPESCFRPYDVRRPDPHAEDGDWVIWSTAPQAKRDTLDAAE